MVRPLKKVLLAESLLKSKLCNLNESRLKTRYLVALYEVLKVAKNYKSLLGLKPGLSSDSLLRSKLAKGEHRISSWGGRRKGIKYAKLSPPNNLGGGGGDAPPLNRLGGGPHPQWTPLKLTTFNLHDF